MREELETFMLRVPQRIILLYSKWYYTVRLEIIMYSSNYNKVNIHIYASVDATKLKTFTTDFFNISELQKMTVINQN
jgi:hypothetical protein